MAERFMFAMYVGDEMLRAFGQAQDGFEVYNLGGGSAYRRESLRQQFEQAQIGYSCSV